MGNLSLILFISFAAPLVLAIIVCRGHSRTMLSFLLFGLVVALFSGELNAVLMQFSSFDQLYFTSNISPFIEEICKAVPILIYAFFYYPKRQDLLECAVLVGVGFAILENAYLFANNIMNVEIITALIRGFGTGTMHALCTLAVGYGLSFIHTKRKLFITGTTALLSAAVIYHAIYNMLVQSEHMLTGFILPTITAIILFFALGGNKRIRKGA